MRLTNPITPGRSSPALRAILTGRPRIATILIVDDLAANRNFLVTVLRHQGHRLLEAADGSQGLAAIEAERPDLVITDVLMPMMDGYELVRQLRLDPATSAIPVVFYTAHYGEREARALALAGGVADVLTKPAESAEVLRVVDRVLSGASQTDTSFGRGSADDAIRSRASSAAHRQALGKSGRPAGPPTRGCER